MRTPRVDSVNPTRLHLRAVWISIGWMMVLTIVWLSLTPSPPDLGIEHGDKFGHFLAYGILMFWFCQLYAARQAQIAYAAGFVAMGVALEFIQGALGYRSYEAFDMLATAVGVLAGWAAARFAGGSLLARIEKELSARLRG